MGNTKIGIGAALAVLLAAVFYANTSLQSSDTWGELSTRLSSGASIYLPGSEGYSNGSRRWTEWMRPNFDAIVRVTSAEDIEQTIKYANQQNRSFLAISGGHGATRSLEEARGAIGIWMRGMKSVKIDPERNIATVGGGITSGELTRLLSSAGKETVTGACSCTGAVAPMLGGGHGWLQGRYGEIADQLISAQLTIANGSTLTVSDKENPDLFWALKGAGHNFGIISEFEMMVYDRPDPDEWSWKQYIFPKNSLQDVFERLNIFIEDAPMELSHLTSILRVPHVEPNDNVLMVLVVWRGSRIPEKYTELLSSAGPIFETGGVTDLVGVFAISAMDDSDVACQPTSLWQRWPIYGQKYKPSSMLETSDLIDRLPPVFNRSQAVMGAFSSPAKAAVASNSTAVPYRQTRIIASPFLISHVRNDELDTEAENYGREFRDLYVKALDAGEPVNSYVNYASGFESQEDVYGHEEWRLEKLRSLKREFDPHGRFNFYVPIQVD